MLLQHERGKEVILRQSGALTLNKPTERYSSLIVLTYYDSTCVICIRPALPRVSTSTTNILESIKISLAKVTLLISVFDLDCGYVFAKWSPLDRAQRAPAWSLAPLADSGRMICLNIDMLG